MTVVNMHEAKTRLSELVARAEAGEEIVIARSGTEAVRLVPVTNRLGTKRVAGDLAGRVALPTDDAWAESDRAVLELLDESLDEDR